jgi:predicted nucleic acid-binding protein
MITMAKAKKKLTSAQRAAKKQRKRDFMIVFMNGKQVRVRRPPAIDGYRFYDSLIVASALNSGARILYSEDLQHGRRIGDLRIENPFL